VIRCDLRQGIPYGDGRFDAVYHSNVLEHFGRVQAETLLRECFRVLRVGGTLRIVVPDLEDIALAYLAALAAAERGEPGAPADHEWMTIELIDQMVRTAPGGDMLRLLSNPLLSNRSFVEKRLGEEARADAAAGLSPAQSPMPAYSSSRWLRILRHPRLLREVAVKRLLGREYELLQLGRFRAGGEVHQWMYDRLSLRRLLERVGFVNVRRVTGSESAIPTWVTYNLEPPGPDLRMEATKQV
jgi:SAM-dependent methyltransferase